MCFHGAEISKRNDGKLNKGRFQSDRFIQVKPIEGTCWDFVRIDITKVHVTVIKGGNKFSGL